MDEIFIREIQKIRESLEKKLSTERYEHTLGVSYTAAALAMRWSGDIRKAELAGLLHDCGKYGTEEELLLRCKRHEVKLSEDDLGSPAVIHGKYGCYLARTKYGITDPEVLNAIAFHTTGRTGMSLLEKVVFTADYIEPLRDRAENLKRIRKLAFTDLDLCMHEMLSATICWLKKRELPIHKDTIQAEADFSALLSARGEGPEAERKKHIRSGE